MDRFRRTDYLSCFYCGRKTSIVNDGKTRSFECANCDAANYLDANGEIADPPVAKTTQSQTSSQYAIPQRTSPQSSPASGNIFCSTCVQNQRLYTSSLAQYLPDDPNDPEYERLERGIYRFKNGLEKRYPQVCAECEPKILERIQQAGYTAKTDHLRRVIDRSMNARRTQKATTLNLIAFVGKWLWLASHTLQSLWHLSLALDLLQEHSPVAGSFARISQSIFLPDILLWLYMLSSLTNFWWSPYFVQSVRGFTSHVYGLPKWYATQAVIPVIRASVCYAVTRNQRPSGVSEVSMAAANLFMVLFAYPLYEVQRRTIKVVPAKLFGQQSRLPAALPPTSVDNIPQVGDTRSMSDLLDEILATPVATPKRPNGYPQSPVDYDAALRSPSPTVVRSAFDPTRPTTRPGNPFAQRQSQNLHLGSLNLSDEKAVPSNQGTVAYEDEMDWAPTQSAQSTKSPHRAFNTYDPTQNSNRGFNASPTETNRGAFWYKVPPAPTSMARRILNPPNPPRISRPPVAVQQKYGFLGAGSATLSKNKDPRDDEDDDDAPRKGNIEFAQPSFFPPPPGNDPRGSLSDLFGNSFSLDPSQSENHPEGAARMSGGSARRDIADTRRRNRPFAETAVLAACLAAWTHGLAAVLPERVVDVQLAVMGVCVLVAAWTLGGAVRRVQAGKATAVFGAVLALAELVGAAYFLHGIWTSTNIETPLDTGRGPELLVDSESMALDDVSVDTGFVGNEVWLIGAMLAHHIWDIFA